MNIRLYLNLFFLLLVFNLYAAPQKAVFDKGAFYSAMASNDVTSVNNQLSVVKASSINEKEAYEGALLMKKAGLVTKATGKTKSL